MEESGGKLVVELFEQSPEAAKGPGNPAGGESIVCLRISDTGPGIAPEIIGRVFEPYFTTKPEGRGTGLGLATVHGIVNGHDGAIDVANEPGSGAVFTINLPALPESTGEDQMPLTVAVQGRGERVLLVDDEYAVLAVNKRMLENAGYDVEAHASPREALRYARDDDAQIDIVVLDYNMPKMMGIDVARELRRIRPNLPIILLTGLATDSTCAKAAEAGIHHVVAKPFKLAEVSALIRSLIDER